jgi:hypothetical protein
VKRGLIAVVVTILSFELPPLAEMLGMQLAGMIWNGLRLVSPYLSQAGDLLGAILAGLIVGLVLRERIWAAIAACAAVALVYVVYVPAALIASPVAAGLAARKSRRGAVFAAALTAMGHLLPFPLPVQVALAATAGLAYSFSP